MFNFCRYCIFTLWDRASRKQWTEESKPRRPVAKTHWQIPINKLHAYFHWFEDEDLTQQYCTAKTVLINKQHLKNTSNALIKFQKPCKRSQMDCGKWCIPSLIKDKNTWKHLSASAKANIQKKKNPKRGGLTPRLTLQRVYKGQFTCWSLLLQHVYFTDINILWC